MRKFSYGLLIFSLIILIVTLLALFLANKPLQVDTYYASVNINESTGAFDLNSTALTFGKVPLYGSSTRIVSFENNYDFPVVLELEARGDIKDYLFFDSIRVVEPAEKISVSVSVISDGSEKIGFYDGYIDFIVKRG